MCLAIPAKIQSVNGIEAEVEIGGVGRTISIMLTPDAQVGDYVYVHTGYAISVVDEADALESLRLLQELAETYPIEELFYTSGDQSLQPSQHSGT
ncbi:MAG: HypC/HybG/HupF family hydrogenase formation chaperone [Anaerolineae bacterium]|jgi:hydrogenase expression/formation protein HypC